MCLTSCFYKKCNYIIDFDENLLHLPMQQGLCKVHSQYKENRVRIMITSKAFQNSIFILFITLLSEE